MRALVWLLEWLPAKTAEWLNMVPGIDRTASYTQRTAACVWARRGVDDRAAAHTGCKIQFCLLGR